MATFQVAPTGIGYLEVTYYELMAYSQIPVLVCDQCYKGLLPSDTLTVIPVLNMAFCEDCKAEKLESVKDYPQDRPIRFKREAFWRDFYNIEAPQGDR